MYSKTEILNQAISYISQSQSGLEIENAKIDFKSNWYDLATNKGINEFIKDTTAIANSFGPDGLIIIGYDEKKRELQETKFSDCGLKDSSQLPDLINKRVDRMFQFDFYEGQIQGFNLGIIHIPPSLDKPHVIRNYQTFDKTTGIIKSSEDHKIFIRRGSSTYPASKSDLELMFYDRKNIQNDYDILATIPIVSTSIVLTGVTDGTWFLDCKINIILENVGRRPVSISSVILTLSLFSDPSSHEKIELRSVGNYISYPVILQSGQLHNVRFELISERYDRKSQVEFFFNEFEKHKKHLKVTQSNITLSSGQIININPLVF